MVSGGVTLQSSMTMPLLAKAASIQDLKIYTELRWLRLVLVKNAQIGGTYMTKINMDGWQLPIVIQQKTKLTAVYAPLPPDGRCITDSKTLPPCKLSFSFLRKAFNYAKYQYVTGDWTQDMTKTYLQVCCVGGDIIKDLIVNQERSALPDLWHLHEEHGVQIENFPDAPMHMLFLGITKHLLGNVDWLFTKKKKLYKQFCTTLSTHLTCGKDLSLDWCNLLQFSDKDAISTVGWQSDQYLAYAWISLVHFGLIEDYDDEIGNVERIAFQRVCVVWFMLLSALFTKNKSNSRFVDDCVKLFLSACLC
jgi:hypothetical protein